MPRSDVIIHLPGFSIRKIERGDPVIYHVEYRRKARCLECGSKRLRLKDKRRRDILHEPLGRRRTVLRLWSNKFHCLDCGRYFYERFEGILPWQRATERLKSQTFAEHGGGVSQSMLAEWRGVGKATIERWYNAEYKRLYRERAHRRAPRVLGIDEHFFSKKQGYATTFCDIAKHSVFDVVLGKSEKDLEAFLQSLTHKDKVRVVCIDLSSSYRALVRKYFPNAKIVADRFHVIRLIQHHMIKSAQQLDPTLKTERAIIKLMRMRKDRLQDKQTLKLKKYFNKNPAVLHLYEFMHNLLDLLRLKQQTVKLCKPLISSFLNNIQMLKNSPLNACKTLAQTLIDWQEEIARMWRFTKSNGITEGFHRKMKLIQRRAYGFKNFQNYRMRVRVLCS